MKKQTLIRWGRRGMAGLLVLISGIVLFYMVERYRGAKEWREAKAALEARGEIVEYQAMIPPPIPDELNVAAIPLFQNLDWDGMGKTVERPWKIVSREGGPSMPLLPTLYEESPYDLKPWRAYFLHALDEKDPGPQVPDAEIILRGLAALTPLLDEVRREMRERPLVRWPVRYEKLWGASMPHGDPVLHLGKAYCLRALAYERLGKTDRALEDLESHFRLAESVGREFLIGALVEMSMDNLGAGVVKQLLEEGGFSAEQTRELQDLLARQNAVESLGDGIRWERAGFCAMALKLKTEDFKTIQVLTADSGGGGSSSFWDLSLGRFLFWAYPRGWMDADRALAARMFQNHLLDHLDGPRRCLDMRAIQEAEKQANEMFKRRPLPKHLLLGLAYPVVSSASRKAGEAQASLALMETACALECYHLQQNRYPEALEKLVPEFIESIPMDPFVCKKLEYKAEDGGKGYLLYSVGLNLQDDGGVPSDRKTKEKEGDMVLRIRR